MHSDLIGKIEKARHYAQEPERVDLGELKATFRGGNDHTITLSDDKWYCDCRFFRDWDTCSHVMAMQKMLEPMLSEQARQAGGPAVMDEQIAGAVS